MSTSSRRRTARFAILAASALLAVPSAASAAGGSGGGGGGGGGGTVKTGVIKVAGSTVAECDNGTSLSVSLSKGRGKTMQEVLVMSGNTAGFWTFRTVLDATGARVMGFGGNRSELGTATSVTTVQTNAALPKGTWDLTFTGVRNELLPGAPLDASGVLLETCVGHLTVVVG